MSLVSRIAVGAVVLAAWTFGARAALADDVVVFDDGTFVDSGGSLGSESDNLQAVLTSLGHTVTTFTGTSDAAWSAALSGQDVLAVPELENGDLAAALPPATIAVIQGFVSGGGKMVVFSTNGGPRVNDLLNTVFGFSTAEGGGGLPSTITAAAFGTRFASGPGALPDNNATVFVQTASLPGGSTSIYENGADSAVALIPFGSGDITFMGWDWFNSSPPNVGGADGGWNSVLDLAVTTPDTTAPTIDCSVIRRVVWAPTNGMIEVGLRLGVHDDVDSNPSVFVTVWSDEPHGPPPYSPDAVFIGPDWESLVLRVRAERNVAPGGNGRVYLLHIAAWDDAGNFATECCTIGVPRMLTTSSIAQVQGEGAEAEAYCHSFGTAPPGYFPLTFAGD
jgi:hypothetical protein